MNSHIIEHNKIRKFILAGDAYFTVVNVITKNKLTFHIIQPKEKSPWFVWATNKKGKFCFLGTIFQRTSGLEYRWGWKNGKFTEDSIINKSFKYLWKKMLLNSLPPKIIFYHDGKCGRCGKRLTDPRSIMRGFGPHCFRILVKRWEAAHI